MCIAMPGEILEINGDTARVDFNGNTLDVNVALVNAQVGKYVLVHAGCAIEVLDRSRGEEMLELFRELEDADNEFTAGR